MTMEQVPEPSQSQMTAAPAPPWYAPLDDDDMAGAAGADASSAPADLTLSDLLPAPQRPPASTGPRSRATVTWTEIKTDRERHLERLEARLAQLQAASRPRASAATAAAATTTSPEAPPRRRLPRTRVGASAATADVHIRPLTEIELLALERGLTASATAPGAATATAGGGPVAEPAPEDAFCLLPPSATADDGDGEGSDDAVPASVDRYAAVLRSARAAGAGSSSDEDGDEDADEDAATDAAPPPSAPWVAAWPASFTTDLS